MSKTSWPLHVITTHIENYSPSLPWRSNGRDRHMSNPTQNTVLNRQSRATLDNMSWALQYRRKAFMEDKEKQAWWSFMMKIWTSQFWAVTVKLLRKALVKLRAYILGPTCKIKENVKTQMNSFSCLLRRVLKRRWKSTARKRNSTGGWGM